MTGTHPASALGRPRHEDATTHEPLEGDAIEDFVLLHRDIPGAIQAQGGWELRRGNGGGLAGKRMLVETKKQRTGVHVNAYD